jgi:hypothetical protein
MTDQLEDMFDGLRTEVLREIRPPGVEAAVRRVRRRRTGTLTAAACATLVAISGVTLLINQPEDRSAPAATSTTSAPAGPDRYAALAHEKLAAADDAIAAFDVQAPVTANYQLKQQVFAADLVLSVACAGTGGQITLVVTGELPRDPEHVMKPREIGRVTVPCGAEPVPATTKIRAPMLELLTFRLTGAAPADGAGFAYRLITRDDTRLSPADPISDASTVLPEQRTADGRTVRSGAHTQEDAPSDHLQSSTLEHLRTGHRYTLMLACRGSGTFRVQIKEDGRVVADHTITCSAPPTPHKFEIGHRFDNGKQTETLSRYSSDSPALASTAYVMIEN